MLTDLLPFIISGIATGAIYGLAGTGLVLTYKTSGIFNLGHGALATVAAYLFYALHVEHGLGWIPSFIISVLVAGPLLGLGVEVIARKLAPQRTAMKIVGTVGLILIVQGLATIKYGPDLINVDGYPPGGNDSFRFGGVNVQYKFIIVTVLSLLIVAALYGLFRFSRLGLAMRAVVDGPDLLDIKGTSPVRIRRYAWMIGSTQGADAFPVLGTRLAQQAGTLSGGQQQMLAMAQAYLSNPFLILVDEASLGLAPVIVDEIFDFVRQVAARGAALLIVDQYIVRALAIAASAYVLRRGEIVYHGSPEELLDGNIFERYLGVV